MYFLLSLLEYKLNFKIITTVETNDNIPINLSVHKEEIQSLKKNFNINDIKSKVTYKAIHYI